MAGGAGQAPLQHALFHERGHGFLQALARGVGGGREGVEGSDGVNRNATEALNTSAETEGHVGNPC